MKPDPLTKKFAWLFISLVPVFAIALNYVLFGSAYFSDLNTFLPATIVTLVISIVLSRTQIWLAHLMRLQFLSHTQLFRRLLFSAIIFIPVTALFVTLIFFGYYWVSFPGYTLVMSNYKWALLTGFIADIVGFAINEAIFIYSEWRLSELEREKLAKSNLQSQLDSLKSQVNPHFLFNSLNSLSSLIEDEPAKAEKFLNEMSKVYRYLLRNNEVELTNLATELQFIQSYFHLLKTRYGDALMLETDIQKNHLDYLIPPLTLQLLVENAVKHNIMLKGQPLIIKLTSDNNDRLKISNNLQLKSNTITSNKIGLTNIAAKYQLMNQPEIVVEQTDNEFVVSIPLINDNVAEKL